MIIRDITWATLSQDPARLVAGSAGLAESYVNLVRDLPAYLAAIGPRLAHTCGLTATSDQRAPASQAAGRPQQEGCGQR